MEEFFNSIRWSEIAPLIAVVVAAPLLLMGGGGLLLRGLQKGDNVWVKALRGVCRLTGARWDKKTERLEEPPRWIPFILWFVAIFAISAWDNGLPFELRILVIGFGYLLALAVGRTWVDEQTRILNGESERSTSTDKMRRVAILSFVVLLALIPLSMDVANGLKWFKGTEGYHLLEWGMATVDLLLRVLIDFLELLNVKLVPVSVEYDSWKGATLALVHFFTLAYVVVNGVSLVAKGDHRTQSELERLKRTGETGHLAQQGTAVLRPLVKILTAPDENTTPLGRAAAAEVIGLIALSDEGKLPDYAFQALLTTGEAELAAVLIPPDTTKPKVPRDYRIRYAITGALGQVNDVRAKALVTKILIQDPQRRVISKAGKSLQEFESYTLQELQTLLKLGIELSGYAKGTLEYTRREAIARFLKESPHHAAPAWVDIEIQKWLMVESAPDVARLLNGIQGSSRANQREQTIAHGIIVLGDAGATPQQQIAAAQALSPYINDDRVRRVLSTRLEAARDVSVRFWLAWSLFQTECRNMTWKKRFMSQLAKLVDDQNPSIRAVACEGLGKLLPAQKSTMPKLQDRANRDLDEEVQEISVISLTRMGDYLTIKKLVNRRGPEFVPSHRSNPDLRREIERILKEREQAELADDESVTPTESSITFPGSNGPADLSELN